MKTLFNTELNKPVGKFRSTPYTVNGKLGTLPPNVAELDVIYADYPTGDIADIVEKWKADLIAKEYQQYYEFRQMTEQEIALREWKHTDYAIRIKAPLTLMMPDPDNTLFHQYYGWFAAQKFPIDRVGEYVYIWCNVILEQHVATMDDLVAGGIIEIEQRP